MECRKQLVYAVVEAIMKVEGGSNEESLEYLLKHV